MNNFEIEIVQQYDWSGGGYEWSSAEIGRDTSGHYWIRAGSGCSCNYIGDEIWEPLRDMNQVHSMVDGLCQENEDIPLKAIFIMSAQGLIGTQS